MENFKGCVLRWEDRLWQTGDAGDGLPLAAPTYTELTDMIRLIHAGRLRRHATCS